jgi:hypothetical protein
MIRTDQTDLDEGAIIPDAPAARVEAVRALTNRNQGALAVVVPIVVGRARTAQVLHVVTDLIAE